MKKNTLSVPRRVLKRKNLVRSNVTDVDLYKLEIGVEFGISESRKS
jgi:hypothetical protein